VAWAGRLSSGRSGPAGAQATRQSSADLGPASGVGPTCDHVAREGSGMYRTLARSALALAFDRFARSRAPVAARSRRAAPLAELRVAAAGRVAGRWPACAAAVRHGAFRPLAAPAVVAQGVWALGAVVLDAGLPAAGFPAAGARAVAAAVKAAPAWAAGLACGVRRPVWAAALPVRAVPVLPRARLVAERAAASVAPGLPR
jgi:hypothetical protein